MICFKDKTFCKSDCTNSSCTRFIYPELFKEAEDSGFDVSCSDFSNNCKDYKKEIK